MPDCSCYVTVINNLDTDLQFLSKYDYHGYWVTSPPATVAAQSASVQIQIKDYFGGAGSEGGYTYVFNHASEPQQNTAQSFACPWIFGGSNYVTDTITTTNLYQVTYRAKSGDGTWQDNSCPPGGHPLYVEFTVAYKTITTSADVSMVTANADYTIQNSSGVVINYSAPVWQTGVNVNDGSGSQFPAAYHAVNQSGCLTVAVSIDYALAGIGFRLVGKIGTQTFFSSDIVAGAPTKQSIPVSLSPGFGVFGQIQGDVTWQLEIQYSNQVITLPTTTRLELYWLYDQPAAMYGKGVWVDALRKIAAGTGATTIAGLATDITQVCFSQFKFKYDTLDGAPHFDVTNLGDYLNMARLFFVGPGELVNCYDQAGILQAFLGAVGIEASKPWAYMKPFGYINTTNLVGWGSCNNPFFQEQTSQMVLAINDPNRSDFANHAFLAMSGDVFDTCQGPYDGSRTLSAYLKAAIDTKTTLYSRGWPPYNRPGTSKDITYWAGIRSVETPPTPPPTADLLQSRLASAVMERVPLTSMTEDAGPRRAVVVDWTGLIETGVFGPDAIVRFDHLAVGATEGLHDWIIRQGEAEVDVQVRIFPLGFEDASRRLLHILASVSNDDPERFTISANDLGHVAVASKRDGGFIVWTWCNATFRVAARGATVDLAAIARRIQAIAEAGTVDAAGAAVPEIGEVRQTAQSVAVGDALGIEVRATGDTRLDVDLRGRALMLTAMTDRTLTFKAMEPGVTEVIVIEADDKTLYAASRAITVTVA